jgi:hypothetical protein
MDFIPKNDFDKCVRRYKGNYRVRKFSCYEQFLCLSFAQLTYRESLRDIETCLRAVQPKLYHSGMRGKVARNTLARANEKRDWRIYADFANVLINRARKLYAGDDFAVEINQTAYAFDSTTIDLCLSLFPWARFRKRKGAVKLHTLLDLRGNIPCFIYISQGRMHDVKALNKLPLEAGALYIMDRAYIDFSRLYEFTQSQAFFIVRAKKNLDYHRKESRIIDKSTGLRCDQTIKLKGQKSRQEYPLPLRRVSYYDADSKKRYVYLSNNFALPALIIAQLYKCRWQIELFFKWIKQHLRIKAFYGTSPNAVKTQIWIAICVYVLAAMVKKEMNIDRSLYEILQILSISLFEKVPIYQLFTEYSDENIDHIDSKQLLLFNI